MTFYQYLFSIFILLLLFYYYYDSIITDSIITMIRKVFI